MLVTLRNTISLAACLLISTPVLANDCGWEKLTVREKRALNAGKNIMRAKFEKDGIHFQIDQWGFSHNPSLEESAANFYDLRAYEDPGNVADIIIKEGQLAAGNPVEYDVIPKSGNAFGKLYQPFTLSPSVRMADNAYNVQINYLTSPKLVEHVFNNVCLAQVEGKVLIGFLSTVRGNPAVSLKNPAFDKAARKILWRNIFGKDVERASKRSTREQVDNLRAALQIKLK